MALCKERDCHYFLPTHSFIWNLSAAGYWNRQHPCPHLCKPLLALCISIRDWEFPWRNMESYSEPKRVRRLKSPVGAMISHQSSAERHIFTLLLRTRCRYIPTSLETTAFYRYRLVMLHRVSESSPGSVVALPCTIMNALMAHPDPNWFLVRKGKLSPFYLGFTLSDGFWESKWILREGFRIPVV